MEKGKEFISFWVNAIFFPRKFFSTICNEQDLKYWISSRFIMFFSIIFLVEISNLYHMSRISNHFSMMNYWPLFIFQTILDGALAAVIYVPITGWLLTPFVLLCGGEKNYKHIQCIFVYSYFPICFLLLLFLIPSCFIYDLPVDIADYNLPYINIAIYLLSFWAVYRAYVGFNTLFKLKKIRAFFFFVVIPFCLLLYFIWLQLKEVNILF